MGKVYTLITGESNAKLFASDLIAQSKWFELTPMPDDQWEFGAKAEPGLPGGDCWTDGLNPPAQDVTELPHVIVTGDPGVGFELYGPFPAFIAASEHAEKDGNLPDHDYWIMAVHPTPAV